MEGGDLRKAPSLREVPRALTLCEGSPMLLAMRWTMRACGRWYRGGFSLRPCAGGLGARRRQGCRAPKAGSVTVRSDAGAGGSRRLAPCVAACRRRAKDSGPLAAGPSGSGRAGQRSGQVRQVSSEESEARARFRRCIASGTRARKARAHVQELAGTGSASCIRPRPSQVSHAG